MIPLLANVDVDDLEAAIRFYADGLGLRLARRLFGGTVAEMAGASSPIYLLRKESGTRATASGTARDYGRHWTPVHLELVVEEIDAAVARARKAGATLEGDVTTHVWGRLATMSDPFGHGFCLIELRGRGYGEVESG
jgi:predicted enzyme related to lactoylglutathione lyase